MWNLWQNFTNHPLEALNERVLLNSIANCLIYFSSVSSLLLILSQMILSRSPSVGLPPPSLRSHPFFFHLRRFLLGMPNCFEMILTSSPAKIQASTIFTLSTACIFSSQVYLRQGPRTFLSPCQSLSDSSSHEVEQLVSKSLKGALVWANPSLYLSKMLSCSIWVEESSLCNRSLRTSILICPLLNFQMNLILVWIIKHLTTILSHRIITDWTWLLGLRQIQSIGFWGFLLLYNLIYIPLIQTMRSFLSLQEKRHAPPRGLTGQRLKDSQIRIGKYKYDSSDQLGKGYSSNVYKGVQMLRPHKRYAIKVINLKKFRGSNIQMLQSQIAIHKSLDHEHIVKLYEVIKTSHHYYLVLQYCPHGNLSEYIAQKKVITEPNAIEIIKQIFVGYRYLISEGVIHRDIKPANILRVGNKWKISDFGFAVKSRFAFKDRMNVGTPLYMAPETIKLNCYSHKSDIYSLGILVYEMLFGKTPHQTDNQKQLLQKVGGEIKIPKQIKNIKLLDFITRSLLSSQARRLSKQQFQTIQFGSSMIPQPSLANSMTNSSSLLSMKNRKISGVGTSTDDSLSNKRRDNSIQHTSNQASKNSSGCNSIPKPLTQPSPIKNPMIANRQFLLMQLQLAKICYNGVQNMNSFQVQQSTRAVLSLSLFKMALKLIRLLSDRQHNHYQLPNWQQYKICKLHIQFQGNLLGLSQRYQKQYLQFIKHNDIKAIRAVNRKFPQLCHHSQLNYKFYQNFKFFILQVLKQHSEVTANMASSQQEPCNDRYQAFYIASVLYKMAQSRITNNIAAFSHDRTQNLHDYGLSKRHKNDFMALKRTLKWN